MTLFYYSPLFLQHVTGQHPERPERLTQVVRHCERTGLLDECQRRQWGPVSPERLARVHDLDYARKVAEFCRHSGGHIEEDTVCGPQSYEVALIAAGAVCDAVEQVVGGHAGNALCLVRPPGHHALRDSAMGFCLFNNMAIAARMAIAELALDRVLIVDWDVHHGNATQAAFWEDGQVGFLSIHRWPFYPGTGWIDETGAGPALGTKLNIPVEMGTGRREYLDRFKIGLEQLASKMRPQLVLISAGFDSHRDDPVGSLGLETEDFIPLSRAVLDVANAFADGKVVSVLEGGYNPGILAGCVELHVRELLQSSAAQRRDRPAD